MKSCCLSTSILTMVHSVSMRLFFDISSTFVTLGLSSRLVIFRLSYQVLPGSTTNKRPNIRGPCLLLYINDYLSVILNDDTWEGCRYVLRHGGQFSACFTGDCAIDIANLAIRQSNYCWVAIVSLFTDTDVQW
jgi:hypothetical protein